MTTRAFDPIAALTANCEQGVMSQIWYQKRPPLEPGPRVIEPRTFVHGASDLLLRAVQYEPEKGVRCFCVGKIIRVEPHHLKLTYVPDAFLDGEVAPHPKSAQGLGPRPIGELKITVPPGTRSAAESKRLKYYIDVVRDAVLDLQIEDWEQKVVAEVRDELKITDGQMRAAHAYVFAEALLGFISDGDLDPGEEESIELLCAALDELGWRPA